jgi:CDP-diacylglycerol--glycerol-3-phosphate 3-phosphatidyltransferase
MNLPNSLTVARLGLTALFVANISLPAPDSIGVQRWPLEATVALLLFVVATVTDWLDGYLARRLNQITDLGKLLDPLADKILVTAALFYLVYHDSLPLWMAVVMVARDFLITGLRTIAASKGVLIPADRAGKHKTVSQFAAIITALVYWTLDELSRHFHADLLNLPFAEAIRVSQMPLYWVATLMSVLSGAWYVWKNRALLHTDPPAAPAA